MSGLLWAGVRDIELVDVGFEAADACRLLSIGVGLARAGAEPARMPELTRQVEPYADSRPGAVPPGRRSDVDKQGKSVRQPPVVGHINKAVAPGGRRSYRYQQLIMVGEDLIQPVHQPVQAPLPPALF